METIFGIVRTLHLPEKYDHPTLGILTNPNNFFNATYSNNTLDYVTTNRSYDKVNPPLNILDLGITPKKLINFFNKFSPNHTKLYLTFLTQLDFLIEKKDNFETEIPYDFLFSNNLNKLLDEAKTDYKNEYFISVPEQADLVSA